jgi:hypothetical protein
MNHILKELIDEGVVVVYLDDILIFTEDLEEHKWIVRRVLQILSKNKLSCKAEKCEFEKQQVDYLGVIIGDGKIAMDPLKVAAIQEWKIPTTPKELRTFLGFINFYRRFIKDFAKMSQHLTPLTGKTEWEWTSIQQEVFDQLKTKVTEEPIIRLPNDNGKYKLETD